MKKGTLSIGIAVPVTLIALTLLALILMNQARAQISCGMQCSRLQTEANPTQSGPGLALLAPHENLLGNGRRGGAVPGLR